MLDKGSVFHARTVLYAASLASLKSRPGQHKIPTQTQKRPAVAIPIFISNRNTANRDACLKNIAVAPKGKVSVTNKCGQSVWVSPEEAERMKEMPTIR
jgi:hypothetical protein